MRNWIWLLALVAIGCSPDPEVQTTRQRQDAALADPFNYSSHPEQNDLSGGGITDFKPKAFKRDVNSVLNP